MTEYEQLAAAFLAGFQASGEGFNGEYPDDATDRVLGKAEAYAAATLGHLTIENTVVIVGA